MSSTLQHYRALSEKLPDSKPDFESGAMRLETKPIDFAHAAEMDKKIQELDPSQGWVCFQSAVAHFTNKQNIPTRNAQTGYILSAEFKLDQTRSLHIRQAEQNWLFTLISEQSGDDLIEQARFLAMIEDSNDKDTHQNSHFLNYRIGWQLQSEHGYQPTVYRFTGFTSERQGGQNA